MKEGRWLNFKTDPKGIDIEEQMDCWSGIFLSEKENSLPLSGGVVILGMNGCQTFECHRDS